MKKTVIAIMMSLCCHGVQAQENLLQTLPASLEASGKAQVVELQMHNTEEYLAMQFSLYLPDGIALRDGAKPFGTLPKNRFPYTEEYDELEDVTTTTFAHSVQFARREGYTTFAISPNDLSAIKGNSGTILRLYVVPEEGLEEGFYPVRIEDVTFTKYEGNKMVSVKVPHAVSSYVTIGSMETGARADLSGMAGYVPKDVCAAMNSWLAGKGGVTELDMSGVDSAGDVILPSNPNAMVYVKEASEYAESLLAARPENIVEGSVCKRLSLADGYAFGATKAFTAAEADYHRTVPAPGWYSLCLPFAAAPASGVAVERFSSVDASAASVTFVEGGIEADVPCIFHTDATEVGFSAENVEIAATPADLHDGVFAGAYTKTGEGSMEGAYALKADGTGFGTAGATAYADPFRAYVRLAGGAKTIKLVHGNATNIDAVAENGLSITAQEGMLAVKSDAGRHDVAVCTVDGRSVMNLTVSEGERKTVALPAGMYLINNKKVIVR